MKVISLIKYSFSIIGALLLFGAGSSYKNTSDFLAEAESASGSVVALLKNKSNESVSYTPVVKFVDREGETFEFVSDISSNPPAYSVGDEVEVLYSPQNPAEAKLEGIALWGSSIILAVLGGVFFATGMLIVLVGRMKKRKQARLRIHGQEVKAGIQSVEWNTRISVNGRHPYVIRSQWLNPRTSEVHLFESDNIWFDPSDYLKDESISVFIDKKNPKKYHVDISFLPKIAA